MSDYRLLALDLDGTLLDDDKQVPAANREALLAVRKRGVHVVFCTGRMLASVEPAQAQIGIDTWVCCYNGAKVFGPLAEGRPVEHHRPVPAERAGPIIDASRAAGVLLNFYHDEVLYAEDRPAHREMVALYESRTRARTHYTDLEEMRAIDPTKLILLAHPERLDALEVELVPILDGLTTARSEPEYLEITRADTHKGAALAAIAERFGVPLEACVAVGDAPNDIPMLRAAGLGVAVASAHPAVLAMADAVTEADNNEGGVAEAVRRFFP